MYVYIYILCIVYGYIHTYVYIYIYSYIHIQPIYPPSCEEPMVSLGYYISRNDRFSICKFAGGCVCINCIHQHEDQYKTTKGTKINREVKGMYSKSMLKLGEYHLTVEGEITSYNTDTSDVVEGE